MAGEEYARIYSWGNDPKRKVSNLYFIAFGIFITFTIEIALIS